MHEADWSIIIAFYLFVAGMGVAAFYTGVLANLFSNDKYPRLAKYGSYIGVPLILLGVLMLVFDLGRPEAFWRFLFHLNPSSTMSVGVWLLTAFSIISVLNALTWLAEDAGESSVLAMFKDKPGLRRATGLTGLAFGILTAGYTGVLLSSTSTVFRSITPLMGMLFLVSATSTGIAVLMLALAWRKEDHHIIQKLAKADAVVIVFEVIIFVLFLINLNTATPEVAAAILSGSYSLLFWVGVIACGLIIPLVVELYSMSSGKGLSSSAAVPAIASVLILIGGFLLRYVLLFAGQSPL
ncbi:MAG: hypothetical protein CVU89_00625 [Firmicutes bacterium HGW-Firmicutes-14]|nr:MAG: hypothetical protein CVU89_00625 [Firmicutes bacterium HGW-Firmicutes-14]